MGEHRNARAWQCRIGINPCVSTDNLVEILWIGRRDL